MSATLDAFELDELGRARLSDEDLRMLDEVHLISMAGGDGINSACPNTTNGRCNNDSKCDGSSNQVLCSNSGSCNTTKNGSQCMNTDVPIEVEP